MRKLSDNNYGSVVPLLLYIFTIIGCGGLYTLFFIETAYPYLLYLIPDSDSKTLIMTGMYGLPLIIMTVGILWIIKSGIKSNESWVYER